AKIPAQAARPPRGGGECGRGQVALSGRATARARRAASGDFDDFARGGARRDRQGPRQASRVRDREAPRGLKEPRSKRALVYAAFAGCLISLSTLPDRIASPSLPSARKSLTKSRTAARSRISCG